MLKCLCFEHFAVFFPISQLAPRNLWLYAFFFLTFEIFFGKKLESLDYICLFFFLNISQILTLLDSYLLMMHFPIISYMVWSLPVMDLGPFMATYGFTLPSYSQLRRIHLSNLLTFKLYHVVLHMYTTIIYFKKNDLLYIHL